MTQPDTARAEGGDDLRAQVADVLRTLALDEQLKARIPGDPVLGPLVRRAARRYVAGETTSEALARIAEINRRGDRATVDYMGESCRDAERAGAEADAFVALSNTLAEGEHDCSVSLDLSHVGLAIDPALALRHARRIAEVTANAGQEMMISMEGSDRTDAVLDVHGALCEQFDHVGVTILARLHRTADDLPVLLSRPGRIRLVKGAYLEPETIAFPRGSRDLREAYLRHARTVIDSGHRCSFATHDRDLLGELDRMLADRSLAGAVPWEFETLLGLGLGELTTMRAKGYPTREYVVYGTEWWLYVCNRIAEEPERLFRAVVDAAGV